MNNRLEETLRAIAAATGGCPTVGVRPHKNDWFASLHWYPEGRGRQAAHTGCDGSTPESAAAGLADLVRSRLEGIQTKANRRAATATEALQALVHVDPDRSET